MIGHPFARVRFRKVKVWLSVLAAIIFGVTVHSTHAEKVVFYADWFASPQFAGIYVALDQGFYAEADLDVELVPFAFGQNAATLLDATPDTCTLGSIEGYIFVQKRAGGANLQALAAMLQESPAGYMTLLENRIDTAADFSGHQIGIHRHADPLFRWFLQRANIDPTQVGLVFVDDDIGRLLRHEIDAMQGYATDEFVRLQMLTGGTARFLSFAQLGFPSYSEILYTTAKQQASHVDTLRRFIEATRRGWTHALAHPEEAVASVVARMEPPDRAHIAASLAALRPYVSPDGQPPLAPMDPEKWRRLQQPYFEMGFLRVVEPVENFTVVPPL